MSEFINPLADLGDKVTKLSTELGLKAFSNPDEVGAAAVDYLRVVGHLVFAYFWARMARVALDHADNGDPFYRAKLATARFYFAYLLPETAASDPQRARRCEAADGHGRIPVLRTVAPQPGSALAQTTESESLRPGVTMKRFHRPQGRRARCRRHGRPDRRPPGQRAGAGGAVRPACERRLEERRRHQGGRGPEEAQARAARHQRRCGADRSRPTTRSTWSNCATAT